MILVEQVDGEIGVGCGTCGKILNDDFGDESTLAGIAAFVAKVLEAELQGWLGFVWPEENNGSVIGEGLRGGDKQTDQKTRISDTATQRHRSELLHRNE